MGIVRKVTKKVLDKAEDAVLGTTEKQVKSVEDSLKKTDDNGKEGDVVTALHAEVRHALADVALSGIDSHPGDYGRCPSYSWHSGGVVPQWEQIALDEARARRLVSLIPALLPDGSRGAVLRLSVTGEQVLSEKDSQISPASGPTVPVGVQPGAGEPAKEGQR